MECWFNCVASLLSYLLQGFELYRRGYLYKKLKYYFFKSAVRLSNVGSIRGWVCTGLHTLCIVYIHIIIWIQSNYQLSILQLSTFKGFEFHPSTIYQFLNPFIHPPYYCLSVSPSIHQSVHLFVAAIIQVY